MYQIAICDDDKLFLQGIATMIKRICIQRKILFKAVLFLSGNALLRMYEQQKRFDLVILDISMPGENGKQIAERLRKYDTAFELIFISSMENEVFNTFCYGIASFIPKNNLYSNFEHEFVRVFKLHENKIQNTFLFKNVEANTYVRYNHCQISYVESVNRAVTLHLSDVSAAPIRISVRSFEELKKELVQYRFVETYRTCVVNVADIYSVNDIDVKLITGDVLPLSRRRKAAVIEAVSACVSEVVT